MSNTHGTKEITNFTPHLSQISKIRLSNDFSKPLVATGGVEKKICVYSLNDKKELLSHKDLPSVPSCLAFDRDDISLVNGAENGQIQIWDLKSQTTKPRTLSGHRAQVTYLEYYQYHNANLLCSGSNDTNIRLWDIRKRGTIFNYSGHTGPITVLKFSPDGKFLVSGSEDNSLKIWDLRKGNCIATKTESNQPINDIKFHPTEMLFAAAGQEKIVNFYDFETFDLVSFSDKTNQPISSIQFDVEGSSLFCLSGENVRQITWEPSSLLNTWQTPFGKNGEMMVSHNKIITAGNKRNTVSAFEIDTTVQIEQKPVMRKSKITSTPLNRNVTNRNNGNNVQTELNMNDIDNPFTGKHLIPRSPPPPSKSSPTHSQSPTESPVKPTQSKTAVSSPKKKIIRPQNPTQNRQKDIPIEIHVAPKLINPNPSKLKDRPKAIVRPNNSMNFDKMENSPIVPVARDLHEKPNAKGDAPRKSSQGSSLEELVNGTSHIIQVFQSKNLKLSKAKYLWQNRKIVDVLRSSIMDRSILYDILSTLISQPEVWTLDIAVEAVHGANELSRVGTDNQVKMASEVTKFVLTRFRDTFQDAFAPVISLPSISHDERSQKCKLITKMVEEIRSNLELSRKGENISYANTLREIDIMMTAMKAS